MSLDQARVRKLRPPILFSFRLSLLLAWMIPLVGTCEEVESKQAIPHSERVFTQDKMAAFYEALGNIFPMTPEMVNQFLETYLANESAVLNRPEPDPLIDFQMVSLDPGEKPSIVMVAPGIASAIGFFDATGAPWPVTQFVVGDSANFEILQLGENSNSLTISPLARGGETNLVISLHEEPTPLVLKVVVSSETVHYQVNFQITRLRPSSETANVGREDEFPMPGNKDLLKALAGTFVPEEAITVVLEGLKAEAWVKGDNLFIRSRFVLLSPPWEGSLAGPDGIFSYQLPLSSVLLFSVGERVKKVTLLLGASGER